MNPTTQQPTETYILQKDWAYIKAGTEYVLKGNFYYAPDGTNASKEFVENNVAWFRRVEVKDWEIASFKHQNGIIVQIVNGRGGLNGIYTVDNYLNDKYDSVKAGSYAIHSVRRLSDGETFSVGEKVKHKEAALCGFIAILNFKIKEGEMYAQGDGFFLSLNTISKFPTPPVEQETIKVYTKEDLKEAFEAARWKVGRSNSDKFSEVTIEDKYPTFSDYIQSLKK